MLLHIMRQPVPNPLDEEAGCFRAGLGEQDRKFVAPEPRDCVCLPDVFLYAVCYGL
jgi:hypothetical protein